VPALIDGWGGESDAGNDATLRGRVRLVEPAGFTKISALGVEEQRVNVLVDPETSDGSWSALGDGYRADVRVIVWEADDVVVAPMGALFRDAEGWTVYVVESDRARERRVTLGRHNGIEAEITGGLSVGDAVVLFPIDLVADVARVEPRT